MGAPLSAPGQPISSIEPDDVDAVFCTSGAAAATPGTAERFGFEVTGEIVLPGGGPKLWPMWRRPR